MIGIRIGLGIDFGIGLKLGAWLRNIARADQLGRLAD